MTTLFKTRSNSWMRTINVKFIVRCGDRLEEWCDDECILEDVRSLSLDRDGCLAR